MVAPSVGSVVLVKFPFSDLFASKLRPGKLFSANTSLMERIVGNLKQPKLTAVVDAVIAVLRPTT